MPPPELTAHVPIANLGEPVLPRLLKVCRHDLRCTRAGCGKRLLGERLCTNEPLRAQAWLQDVVAALAARRVRRMRLDRNQETKLLERGDDRLARLEAIHPSERCWGVGNDARGLIKNGWRWEVVPQANLAVVRIMRRGDLYCARAEAHFNKGVSNHWNGAVHKRHHHALPNECGVARIVGVHGDASVAKECLWSGCCHNNAAVGVAPF